MLILGGLGFLCSGLFGRFLGCSGFGGGRLFGSGGLSRGLGLCCAGAEADCHDRNEKQCNDLLHFLFPPERFVCGFPQRLR